MCGQEYGLISKASVDEHIEINNSCMTVYIEHHAQDSEDTHKYLVNHI